MDVDADVTTLLVAWRHGDADAFKVLFDRLYEDLRRRARACLRDERPGHTWSTTDLVHESYLRLVAIERVNWQDRAHFLAVASRAMRRVLVSHARERDAARRGGGARLLSLDGAPLVTELMADSRATDLLALDLALDRLATVSERLARTVELRYFGGLTVDEIAGAMNLAPSTVKLDWEKARAWLYRELAG